MAIRYLDLFKAVYNCGSISVAGMVFHLCDNGWTFEQLKQAAADQNIDLTDDFGARLAQLTDDDIDLLEQSYPDASHLRDTLPAPYDTIQLSDFDVQAFFSPPDSIVELGEPLDTDLLDNLRGTSILPTIDDIFIQQIEGFNIALIDFADYAFLFEPTQELADDDTIAIPIPGAGIDPEEFWAAILLLLLLWLNLIRNIPWDTTPNDEDSCDIRLMPGETVAEVIFGSPLQDKINGVRVVSNAERPFIYSELVETYAREFCRGSLAPDIEISPARGFDMLADGHHRFVASRLVTKRRPHLALVVSALLPVIYLEDVNIDESDRGKYFYEWEDLPFR